MVNVGQYGWRWRVGDSFFLGVPFATVQLKIQEFVCKIAWPSLLNALTLHFESFLKQIVPHPFRVKLSSIIDSTLSST